MGETTSIAWCDHTFSPWVGCTKVSPGCAHCYAEALDRRTGHARWGKDAKRERTSADYWKQPLKWNRKAAEAGVRRRVFCGSLCDVFDAQVPDVWRVELFDVIRRTPWLDWQLLTKRPENIGRLVTAAIDAFPCAPDAAMTTVDELLQPWVEGHAPANVWLGVSVENQEQADKRIPLLLQQEAAVRFLSMEPLLGPVDLSAFFGGPYVALPGDRVEPNYNFGIHWVIVGGESGPQARPFDLAWARSIRDQCKAAGVACFVKQLGAAASDPVNGIAGAHLRIHPDASALASKRLADPKGGDWDEWPADLRVRESPDGAR